MRRSHGRVAAAGPGLRRELVELRRRLRGGPDAADDALPAAAAARRRPAVVGIAATAARQPGAGAVRVGPPSRRRSYGTLGERLGEGLRPPIGWNSSVASDAVFEPPERPSTAPVDDRARARDQQNVALLISSMQELTAVVATHSEEIRRLREDCRAFARRDAINEALSMWH